MFEKILRFFKQLLGFFTAQNKTSVIQKTSVTENTSVVQNTRTSSEEHLDSQQSTYSAELIPQLKTEHEQLVAMYVGIQDLFENHRYHQVVEQLSRFKEDFSLHLMQENVKFYAYLESHLSHESEEFQTIKTYRKDMNQIAHVVVKFLKKWTAQIPLDTSTSDEFLQEYKAIGGALVQRITDEEQYLYTLYHPNIV